VASLLVDELASTAGVRGCLCLGYPFHPPGKPQQTRTQHLAALRTPTLILQGERDTFGRPEEVATYALSPRVQLGWIADGDHSFVPSRRSGRSDGENWATAVAWSDAFLRGLVGQARGQGDRAGG
jgi:predicted alpha/beta-hydrolase family hydrolase